MQSTQMDSPFETPVDVLNYALTLEHLEATFYREAMERFTGDDFLRCGKGVGRVETDPDDRFHRERVRGWIVKSVIDIVGGAVVRSQRAQPAIVKRREGIG